MFMTHFSFGAVLRACLFSLSAAALCLPASAHVTLEYGVANANTYYKANFKIGHGCGASATRQVVVQIPAGVQGAKPMPKAGWVIDIERTQLAQPYKDHGRTVTEVVSRITWTAKTEADALPNNFYDEFALQAKLGMPAGLVYWPVSQVCQEGRLDWTQTPKAGQKPSDLQFPAALLEVLPASGGHAH
jgi:uncharacterized protein YcnI